MGFSSSLYSLVVWQANHREARWQSRDQHSRFACSCTFVWLFAQSVMTNSVEQSHCRKTNSSSCSQENPACYWNRRFVTVFTTARHRSALAHTVTACVWGKGKVVPTRKHENICGSGGLVPLILNIGTRWRWAVSLTPRPLYPGGKSPC